MYQDTMLKLLEKRLLLRTQQNTKGYALSVSLLLWKNKRKKHANRNRLIPMDSIERMKSEDNLELTDVSAFFVSSSWRRSISPPHIRSSGITNILYT